MKMMTNSTPHQDIPADAVKDWMESLGFEKQGAGYIGKVNGLYRSINAEAANFFYQQSHPTPPAPGADTRQPIVSKLMEHEAFRQMDVSDVQAFADELIGVMAPQASTGAGEGELDRKLFAILKRLQVKTLQDYDTARADGSELASTLLPDAWSAKLDQAKEELHTLFKSQTPPNPLPAGMEGLIEQLAAIEHERWADWQKWCHKVLREQLNPNSAHNDLEDVLVRWDKQIAKSYAELSEAEKQSDRDQVMRYLPLLTPYIEVENLKARFVEVDLLEQAINSGRDMNAYKLQRLADLEARLQANQKGGIEHGNN
jgi:hypothetical protein